MTAWRGTRAGALIGMIGCMVPTASVSPAGRMPGELRSRHLLVRVAEITAVIALVALAITALPGLDEVRRRLQGADPVWVVAIAVAEYRLMWWLSAGVPVDVLLADAVGIEL